VDGSGKSARWRPDQEFFGALDLTVSVTLVNGALKAIGPSFGLRRSELALIFAMGLVATTIPTASTTRFAPDAERKRLTILMRNLKQCSVETED